MINNVYKWVNQIIKWNTNNAPVVNCHFIIKATQCSHGPKVTAWSWKRSGVTSEGHPWPVWTGSLGLTSGAGSSTQFLSYSHLLRGHLCQSNLPALVWERQASPTTATPCLSLSGTLREESEIIDSIYNSEFLEHPILGPSRIFSFLTGMRTLLKPFLPST